MNGLLEALGGREALNSALDFLGFLAIVLIPLLLVWQLPL